MCVNICLSTAACVLMSNYVAFFFLTCLFCSSLGNISWIELLYAARKKCGTGSIKQVPQISFNKPKMNLDERVSF